MALHRGEEFWVFSTDSYAWTEPLRGQVMESGATSAGPRMGATTAIGRAFNHRRGTSGPNAPAT